MDSTCNNNNKDFDEDYGFNIPPYLEKEISLFKFKFIQKKTFMINK